HRNVHFGVGAAQRLPYPDGAFDVVILSWMLSCIARKGMVDALREVHRVLVPCGILIDARPDSRVHAYVERRRGRGFQRFGVERTNSTELKHDRASDRAIARLVADGSFTGRRRGRSG